MSEGPLGSLLVVKREVMPKRIGQFLRRAEPRASQDLGDKPVEALDHAVGLGMARRN